VPKSRIRKKSDYIAPNKAAVKVGSPAWLVPLMVGLLVGGLAWIVVYYVSQSALPIPGIVHWNLIIGFGLILAGFVLSTKWK
jgi:Uncharacterised protein family (UPF0233).